MDENKIRKLSIIIVISFISFILGAQFGPHPKPIFKIDTEIEPILLTAITAPHSCNFKNCRLHGQTKFKSTYDHEEESFLYTGDSLHWTHPSWSSERVLVEILNTVIHSLNKSIKDFQVELVGDSARIYARNGQFVTTVRCENIGIARGNLVEKDDD
ncbi:MAG: hypothetical protein ABI208_00170 [Ginsengibacter sp.]|jgi:hypothetical protein